MYPDIEKVKSSDVPQKVIEMIATFPGLLGTLSNGHLNLR